MGKFELGRGRRGKLRAILARVSAVSRNELELGELLAPSSDSAAVDFQHVSIRFSAPGPLFEEPRSILTIPESFNNITGNKVFCAPFLQLEPMTNILIQMRNFWIRGSVESDMIG